MAINHRYLIGKEIDYDYGDGEIIKGIVVGVDKNIGITIVKKDNKKFNLLCLNGPSTKFFKEKNYKLSAYKKVFKNLINDIKNGKVSSEETDDELEMMGFDKETQFNGIASCPFS